MTNLLNLFLVEFTFSTLNLLVFGLNCVIFSSLNLLVFGLNVMIIFGLNQIMLRRHQGLVLDHDEAEAEEEKGLHSASDRMLLADHRVQFNFDTNWT